MNEANQDISSPGYRMYMSLSNGTVSFGEALRTNRNGNGLVTISGKNLQKKTIFVSVHVAIITDHGC